MTYPEKLTAWLPLTLTATLSCAALLSTLSALSASADSNTSALHTAQHHVRRYASILQFPHPIEVRLLPDSDMPVIRRADVTFTAAAYATRTSMTEPGCTLTFSDAAIRSLNSLAHETCHCALDYHRLEPGGYKWGTTQREILRREGNAGRCAAWLTDLSATVDRERRAGKWPREFADYKPITEED